MNFVDSLTGRGWERLRAEDVLKFTPLHPIVQKHVAKVYANLAGAVLMAAAGVWLSIARITPTWFAAVAFWIGLASTFALVAFPAIKQTWRYGLLGTAAFCDGAIIAPIVAASLHVNPSIVLTAFIGTFAVFACFSFAALLAKRRTYLYLGGWLSSAMLALAAMRLATWLFGGRQLAFAAELYVGLLVFAGYVIFDTQVIVEKASAGDYDHIGDALTLFIDFIGIFVRVLIILMQNEEKKREKERRRKD